MIDFDTKYDLAKSTGVLNPSVVKIGNAKSNLNGNYKSEGDQFAVDMKLNGQGLPATDLSRFACVRHYLAHRLEVDCGTLSTNLHITGRSERLVTTERWPV